MKNWLTIGDFANRSGLTPRALRIYEELGLINSVTRGDNGYRYYGEEQFETVRRVKILKDMGFALREIKAIFLNDLKFEDVEVKNIYRSRLHAIDEIVADLQRQKVIISSAISKLEHRNLELDFNERSYLMSQIEKELPLMSVRDVVMFPSQRRALWVGREFSKKSIHQSIENHGGSIIVATQKSVEMNDMPDPDQLFEVGCLCKILDITSNEDGTLKIVLEAKTRWHIIDLRDRDGARFCRGIEIQNSLSSKLSQSSKDALANRVLALIPSAAISMNTAVGESEFVARALDALIVTAEKPVKKDVFRIDSLTAEETGDINLRLARIQEILVEQDANLMTEKILALFPITP